MRDRGVLFNWVSRALITQTAFYKNPENPINIRVLNGAKGYKIGTYRGSAVEEYLTASKRIDLWASNTLSATHLAKKEKRDC